MIYGWNSTALKHRNIVCPTTDLCDNVPSGGHGFCPYFGEIMRINLYFISQAHLVSFAELEQQNICLAIWEEKTNSNRKQSGFVTLFV